MRKMTTGIASLLLSLSLMPLARAALLAEESFDYATDQSINGQNGGTGWSGVWYNNITNYCKTKADAMASINGVKEVGGMVQLHAAGTGGVIIQTRRDFSHGVADVAGKACWIAFEVQTGGFFKNDQYFYLRHAGVDIGPILTLKTGGGCAAFGTSWTSGNAQLMLFKVVMRGTGVPEDITLYVDPDLSQPSTSWTAKASGTLSMDSGFDGVNFRNNSATSTGALAPYNVDELRIATSWREAVGQPASGIWDGGNAGGAWSLGGSGGNWSGVVSPTSGSDMDLVFGANVNGQVSSNDIADPFLIDTLTFNTDVTLTGWPLKFSGDRRVIDVAAGKTATMNNDLVLGSAQTYFQGAGNGVIAGRVQDDMSANGLTKDGSGTWTLSNANTYSGLTRINNGTLALGAGGAIASSSGVQVSPGAVFDVSAASAPGFTLGSGRTLSGGGTVKGALTANSGSVVAPGMSMGTLTNDLSGGEKATFDAGAVFTMELGVPGSSDAIAFTGLSAGVTGITFNGNAVNLSNAGGLAPGTYTLFTFDAANAYGGTLTTVSSPEGFTPALVYNSSSIQLTMTANALSAVTIAATADGAEDGPVNGSFAISRPADAATSAAVTVYYSVDAGSTATAGSDFAALPGSVTLGAGETNATVTVPVLPDLNFQEGDETVNLSLTPDTGYTIGTPGTATVHIADGVKSAVTILKTADGSEEGPVNASFAVRRPTGLATGLAITVYYSVDAASTATAGSDYTALPGNVVLGAGVTNAAIIVPVLKDTAFSEGPETVILRLTTNAAYTVGDPSNATVSIADATRPVITIAKTSDASEYGPVNGAFTVNRDAAGTGSAVTVYYAVTGSATAGSDYSALASNVTMGMGVTNVTIPLFVVRDGIYNEATETVQLDLIPDGFYAPGDPSSATANITDDARPVPGETRSFAAIYTFADAVAGTVVDPTPLPYETAVSFGPFSMQGIISPNGMAGAFYAQNWRNATLGEPSSATLCTNQYFTAAVTPLGGARMTLTNITFEVARQTSGGYGPTSWAVRSSLDSYAANLAPLTINPANINLTVMNNDTLLIGLGAAQGVFQAGASLALDSRFADITNCVTFRIYGWNHSDAKDGGIDNFTIYGSWSTPPAGMIMLIR